LQQPNLIAIYMQMLH